MFDKFRLGKFTPEMTNFSDWMTSKFTATNPELLKRFQNLQHHGIVNKRILKSKDVSLIHTRNSLVQMIIPRPIRYADASTLFDLFNVKLRRQRLLLKLGVSDILLSKPTGKYYVIRSCITNYTYEELLKICELRTLKKLKRIQNGREKYPFEYTMKLPKNWPDYLYMCNQGTHF